MDHEARNDAPAPLFDHGLSHVEALASRRLLLGFDYDGTLAPMVPDPRRARMRPTTRTLFAEVIARFPCAVISGRARDDVAAMLGDCRPLAIIGNHGIETEGDSVPPPPEQLLRAWHAELEERLETLSGIVIEDKAYSLTIHYRGAREPVLAKARALRAARALESVRIVTGAWSLNLMPQGSPHKGTALLNTADNMACGSALFIGDDRTDEDAFGVAPARVVGIRIGESSRSAARYFLQDQAEIDRLLQMLLSLRTRWDGIS